MKYSPKLFGHIQNSDDPFRSVQEYKTAVLWTRRRTAVKNGLFELLKKIPDGVKIGLDLLRKLINTKR